MLHTCNKNQENVTHAHQVAGAVKASALAPKTPGQQRAGNVPARKVPLNDENSVTRLGKGTAKDAFQTPAQRDRAPLGAKTTNAKAKSVATPAAPFTTAKDVSQIKTPAQQRATSARKSKLRIHASPRSELPDAGPLKQEPAVGTTEDLGVQVSDDSEPEIDRALRLPEPNLPDYDSDSDVNIDRTFSMLKPENIMRGAGHIYHNAKGPDGLTDAERREKEWNEETERYIAEEERKMTERALTVDPDGWDQLCREEAGRQSMRSSEDVTCKPKPGHARAKSSVIDRKPPSEAISKSAANALSTGSRSTHQRSASAASSRFAAPTAASQARQAIVAKQSSHDIPSLQHSKTRSITGPMASRATIGRAKGRQISAEVRELDASKPTRTRPRQTSQTPAENETHSGQGTYGNVIEYMTRKYEEEQERIAGVNPSLDGDNIEALQQALEEDIDSEYAGFRLE